MKITRRRFIQIILPSFKVLLESSSKASKNFKISDPSKICQIQTQKPQRTSTHKPLDTKNIEEHTKKHEEQNF